MLNLEPPAFDMVEPVTILLDRYGGTYSNGRWLAFPCDPDEVPEAVWDEDIPCMTWWKEAGDFPIGRGRSPNDAYLDLVSRLERLQPDRTHPPKLPGNPQMWTWELEWPGGATSIVDRVWSGTGSGPPGSSA
jgi:hypothetical protein